MTDRRSMWLVAGPAIAAYGFPGGHPFGPDRHAAFMAELARSASFDALKQASPSSCTREELLSFHTPEHVDRVAMLSVRGQGYLDGGDTPAFPGVFEAACSVVGATLTAMRAIMTSNTPRAFVPIAGLHHAARNAAAGFCVFNDCGVAIEIARREFGLERIAYVDIDAHHGDGVFYAFDDDPGVAIADLHEDGRFLYPGTGRADETGIGPAVGTKLNVPLPPGAGDREFHAAWPAVEKLLRAARPELILLQAGADSLRGDPITHLAFSEAAHAHAATRLRTLADECCEGRLLALGGGGYDRDNLARAWTRVVEALV